MTVLLLAAVVAPVAAQQPAKPKRPVRNPPQYPNIIDLENRDQQEKAEKAEKAEASEEEKKFREALVNAVGSLAGELRLLSEELRLINLRQQAQFDLMKISRLDSRVEFYERELRSVRERLYALDTEEQRIQQLLTPDSLLAQSTGIATFNRDQAVQQIKAGHEARLRAIQSERERLRASESELISSLSAYQGVAGDAEKRIEAAEEKLRQIEALIQSRRDKAESADNAKKPKP